ncbi:MAG: glycosyltransferase family 2 protein [Muribaculaceae bacterium]|nr:glycosyltransferase family 2 protein [Muribaculaceae bacterium]
MNHPVIAIVVPCFNEEQALPVSVPQMLAVLDGLVAEGLASSESYVLLCNDGSKDDTWRVITELHQADARVKGISLAHNRGHQNVLLAGLMTVCDRCDAAISIDADMQDDPAAITEMVRRFKEGKEIVYGVRSSRKTDTWFKRTSAHAFYSFQKKMGLETVFDHADYRLMSNRALKLLGEYGESNLFLRGIIPQIGLENDIVTYARSERVAGESKYPFAKMLAFSIDGITSFSARPMRWIFMTGLTLLFIDILVAVYVFVSLLFSSHISAGWASLMLSVWALGSLILIAIGIVGEYIGKIFTEVKHRPRYAVADMLWD